MKKPKFRVKPEAFDFFYLSFIANDRTLWHSLIFDLINSASGTTEFPGYNEYTAMYQFVDLDGWYTLFGWLSSQNAADLKFNEIDWELI